LVAVGDTTVKAAAEVRARLVEALEAELIGPFYSAGYEGPTDEALPLPPSRWYLTGFLAPIEHRETGDPTSDDTLEEGPEDDPEDTGGPEGEPKLRRQYPASIGLSVLLPPKGDADDRVRVTVTLATYVREPREVEGRKRPKDHWRRVAHPPKTATLGLSPAEVEKGVMVPDTTGVWVRGKVAQAEAPGLAPGTRALSLFVVNQRPVPEKPPFDEAYLFEVGMALEYAPGFVARPNRRGENASDWDDKVVDLQFRNRFEHAVGHGVSARVPEGQTDRVTRVETTWLPRFEVRRVVTREIDEVETGMEALAALESGEAARRALAPMVEQYGKWLAEQAKIPLDSEERERTRDEILKRARHARERITAGLDLLATDAEVFEAFRLMNRAMADAALQRTPERYQGDVRPRWRLFQLAFVLLNLKGIADPAHEDRENVELVFFPTGGGKTEAYLGVIGFTLLLRRMRGQARDDKGLGVAVLLRYTLRLLTLDQLGRAATLVCALEMLRQEAPDKLGAERFAVGLWVGRSATANTMEQVSKLITEYKNSPSKTLPSPFPLSNCPWCNKELNATSLQKPTPAKPDQVLVGCVDLKCPFNRNRNPEGLPVLFVDEQIYRELPAFVVGTVDKFAMLPWRGETGKLFGRVTHQDGVGFCGPMDPRPKAKGQALPHGLLPPELIVQDELHLISGPLGTMAGLYETAIEHLCTHAGPDGQVTRPKILASTATVRRAREQIRALFARRDIALFPPPGVDDSETWFAEVDGKSPGRLYVGVAAQGRSMKGILLRTYVDLLCAAQKQYEEAGAEVGDPYMTVAGYFNSLRELGGMRRLVEDDVRLRATKVEDKHPVDHEGPHPTLKNRLVQMEPVELTSRESTARIKAAKDRLNVPHASAGHVDVLLASNMISVGVDIDRLGLMVVAGQPKTTAEYIQASSRVGRQHPGLVVTCLNLVKPRDRSHFERFAAYHESFYRYVEATSLTPFSGPALERGLAGTLVGMARLSLEALTPPAAAMDVREHRQLAERLVEVLAERAGRHASLSAKEHARLVQSVRERGLALLDSWETVVARARKDAAKRSYSQLDKDKTAGPGLLHMAGGDESLDELPADEARFVAPTSMRDVEETVHLWIERRALGRSR
jgi:hypothetical protein